MASIYTLGGSGPWSMDDDFVHLDGHYSSGVGHATNGPTVDGLGLGARGPRSGNRGNSDSSDLRQGRVLRYEDRRI